MIIEDNRLIQAGDFKVIKSLAKSGFSNVYLAEHITTKKRYALKAIKNPNNKARIENEINILKHLHSLNITMNLQKVFFDDKKLFLLYDLADGGSLYEYIENRDIMSEEEILKIFKSILLSLKELHKHGLTHHDIKPHNVLINDGKYYWCDFGLSVLNQKDDHLLHLKTDTLYAAPEIYHGFSNKSSDIYALGVTLYYMATKEQVFDLQRGDSTAFRILAHSKLNIDFTKIKSKKIQYLVQRMMDKSHRQRASIPEIEYILMNSYDDFNLEQNPLDYTIEKQRKEKDIYEELSADNIAFAQNNLAAMVSRKNPKKAFELYSKAAHNGLIKAYYNLGLCYKDGIGCQKDINKSYSCFKEAAIHNHDSSLFMTALFHECGVSVDKDLDKAYQLYYKSAFHGNKKAYEKLKSEIFLSQNKKKLNYNHSS